MSSMDIYSGENNWETPTGDNKIEKPKNNNNYKKEEEIKKDNKDIIKIKRMKIK